MKRFVVLLLLVACAPVTHASTTARVERVVDGDTIIVTIDGARTRIRLIGVDTPETVKPGTPVQCYGPQASAFTKHALNGEDVRLEYDRDRTDRYGRTLAYVYRARDDLFVNLALVQQGYARALDIAPDHAHASELALAQKAAQTAKRGLWGACG